MIHALALADRLDLGLCCGSAVGRLRTPNGSTYEDGRTRRIGGIAATYDGGIRPAVDIAQVNASAIQRG